MTERPAIDVAVVMRKERLPAGHDRWQQWRWRLDEVLANQESFGTQLRLLRRSEDGESWLHPGFKVELFSDDAEGYLLNVSTPAPCWFVLWRMQEPGDLGDQAMALPVAVSLSYHDAGRWLDAQETVDQLPAPAQVVQWLDAFASQHFVAEPKRRRRPESFRPLQDRFGNPASVSTGKKMGSGDGR